MSIPFFTFASENETTGFEAYRELYAGGSDVAATGAPFQARVEAHRLERLIVFERRLSGVAHSRDPARVRRDGYDHFTLQLLYDGHFRGGRLGDERALAPGDVILFDMAQPQNTRADDAHFLTFSLARDVVEAAAPHARLFHGSILPRAFSGPLADLMRSLALHGSALPPHTAMHALQAVAALLAIALAGDAPDLEAGAPAARIASLRLERAQAFIDARLADPRLDADAVASGVALSRSVLYRLFAPAGGVAQFILCRRLERLRAALRRPNELRPISTLAYDFGFSSESHCSRAFRAVYGLPPGRYRAEICATRPADADRAVARDVIADWVHGLY